MCCPTERRISFQSNINLKYVNDNPELFFICIYFIFTECEEYSRTTDEKTGNKASPLLPIEYQGTDKKSEGKPEIHKQGFAQLFVVGGSEAALADFPHSVTILSGSQSYNLIQAL